MIISLVASIIDTIVPFYTLIAIVVIVLYIQNTKDLKKSNKLYRLVKKAKEVGPNDWKKAFAGNWTLKNREKDFKDFLIGEGFGGFKIGVVSNIGHTLALQFENNDVDGRLQVIGTGVPSGTIPFCSLKKEKMPVTVDGRVNVFEMYWNDEEKSLNVDFEDMDYPLKKGGRRMHIIRTMVDDNTMKTVYEQTTLADNVQTGYTQYTTRVV